MRNRFTFSFSELPSSLPIFPLSGAVLLPNGQLPLNIFEDRYLSMINDALSNSRLVGMVQPKNDADKNHDEGNGPELYATGCAGRIVSFSETRDDRYLIILAGVCRFDIKEEIECANGYRRAEVVWDRFSDDLGDDDTDLDSSDLIESARRYTEQRKLSVDWSALDHLEPRELVDTLACSLPFSPQDKQGLVETVVIRDRVQLLTALCEFGAVEVNEGSSVAH